MKNHTLVQAHLIATNKYSYIALQRKKLFLSKNVEYVGESILTLDEFDPIPQHIYFTTDEEIKEGDWMWDSNGIQGITKSTLNLHKGVWKKIVATTNTELWYPETPHSSSPYDEPRQIIAGIPNDFIELYVKRWNEGNPIKEVWLEQKFEMSTRGSTHILDYPLKLSLDGNVIWNTEEEEKKFTLQDMEASFAEGVNAGKMMNELPTPRVRFKEFMNKNY